MNGGTVKKRERITGYDSGQAKLYRGPGSSPTPLTPSDISRLTCPCCSAILREPRQVTACGCRYCSACVQELTQERYPGDDVFSCAVDEVKYTKRDIRRDRGCQREIEGLLVDCPTRPEPCSWRGPLPSMEDHMKEKCPKRQVVCECGAQYTAEELEEHQQTDCPGKPSESLFRSHQPTQLNQGLKSDPDSIVSCPCTECDFQGEMRSMNDHFASSHILQLNQEFLTTRNELAVLRAENLTLRSQVSTLASQVDKLLESDAAKEAELRALKKMIERLLKEEREVACYRGELVESDSVAHNRERRGDENGSRESRLQRISETIFTLQGVVAEHGNQLEDVRLRQDILDVKTTDGVLVWKIPDVRRRYHEAVERKTLSLYSPPFYTGQHSYKACIRIYLNGDGIGKGTHVSLFFFLMRSEHDNLLSWPFKQSVRFTLLHQTKPSSSISEAFIPDSKSASFKKPESDMNVASGFPKFARQTVLQDKGFTQDNMIFVKCQVDMNGMYQV